MAEASSESKLSHMNFSEQQTYLQNVYKKLKLHLEAIPESLALTKMPTNFKGMATANPDKYPANMGQPWSADDEDTLLTLIQEGKTQDELAVHFQRTPGGLRARINQIAYEMVEAGAPHTNVCASTGLTQTMLEKVIAMRETAASTKGEKKVKAAAPAAAPEPAPSLAAAVITHSLEQTQREILEVLKETRDLLKVFVNSIEVKEE